MEVRDDQIIRSLNKRGDINSNPLEPAGSDAYFVMRRAQYV